MNKKELEGVVFDADGTLFDTERLGYWAWEEAGRQMGCPQAADCYPEVVGRGRGDVLALLPRLLGPDFPHEPFMELRSRLATERMAKSEAGRRLVYPDGVPYEVLQAEARTARVIRVAFNGGTSYQPLIASLAIDCGIKANILGADTRNIDGRAFGTMLLGLPDDDVLAGKAMAYIAGQKDITVEEVPDYHG